MFENGGSFDKAAESDGRGSGTPGHHRRSDGKELMFGKELGEEQNLDR